MSRQDVLVVLPARHGSTRFPGKVLAKLGSRSVLEWGYRAAKAAGLGRVVIATEDKRVVEAAAAFGAEAILTPKTCASGTDRVFLAARKSREPFVVNLQADQPLIKPGTLRRVAKILRANKGADIATAVIPLDDKKRAKNPNVVKAALAAGGRCLYFSRSPIPFPRSGAPAAQWEHLGIYGFTRAALKRFVQLPPSPLEKMESLEQLRALEDGMTIFAATVTDVPVAIDTPEDLRRAEKFLRKKGARR
ncbi:MAG: 3-deoxy-manno-octulosonate cytidylyltransferase [Elusimicrobia bacterium]|nr:3-deoxy-manno-octulosonate cytidylyltransferase [Elusimicrobiota bacterium]MDE2312655.1 3-deoxy-manno-octulosonate cytidylyltransferase [Elusimicrobiota bacterium]